MKTMITTLFSLLITTAAGAQELTKNPELLKPVEATYPEAALQDRVSAQIVLEIEIDTTGKATVTGVASATTSRGADVFGFEAAARAAAADLAFIPGEVEGKPVPVRVTYTFNFLPPEKAPEAPAVIEAPHVPKKSLTGVAIERGTRRKLPGVRITAFQKEGEGFETLSGADGAFHFNDLEPGLWKIWAELEGYYPFHTREEIRGDELVEVTYHLEKGSYNPYDVLVEGERPKKEVNRRTLDKEAIAKVPGTLGDPIQAVENLPGVARPQLGRGQIIVRGSGPQDTGVFVEGISLPIIYHFGGLRSVVPGEMIDRIEFYPGNFSLSYGRFTGGILDARLRSPATDRLHAVVDVSLLDAAVMIEVPVGDTLSFAVAGRRSYIDVIMNAVVPSDDVSLVSAPRYYDYQIMGQWRPSPEHSLRAVFLGSDDEAVLLFGQAGEIDAQLRSGDTQLRTNFQRLIASHQFTPSASFKNQLTASFGFDDNSGAFGGRFRFNLAAERIQVRDEARWQIAPAFALGFGADLISTNADVEVLAPRPPREGQPSFNTDLEDALYTRREGIKDVVFAPFAELELKPFEGLTIIPGIRADYFEQLSTTTFDPRIVARYELSEEITIKGGAGLVHQAPTPQELDPVFGNPGLGPQQARQYSAGAEWRPADHLNFDLTFFYKDVRDLVSSTGALIERDGRTIPLVYDNGGRGEVFGMELFARHDFSDNLRGWVSYTLSSAKRLDSGATEWRPFDFDQTHIFNVVASYRFPSNWELGVRWRLVTGNPSTPFSGAVYYSDIDDYAPVAAKANSSRLPMFHQLDVRLDKTWVWDDWMLTTYLSLANAYNRGNVEGYSYNYDYTASDATTGLPILPIIGLKAEL